MRAERHRKAADGAALELEALYDMAEASGGPYDALTTAMRRPCPKCDAPGGSPCVNMRTGAPLENRHRERVGDRELKARQTWHDRRGKGQENRFANVRGCGGKMFAVRCRGCQGPGKAHPQGCDVWRVCERCSIRQAKERQARFGRARGRVLMDAMRKIPGRGVLAGPGAKYRKGGRYTDKMVTLTIPHFSGEKLWWKALDIQAACPKSAKVAERIRKILTS